MPSQFKTLVWRRKKKAKPNSGCTADTVHQNTFIHDCYPPTVWGGMKQFQFVSIRAFSLVKSRRLTLWWTALVRLIWIWTRSDRFTRDFFQKSRYEFMVSKFADTDSCLLATGRVQRWRFRYPRYAQILGPGLKDVGSHVVLMVWQRQMVEQQWLHAHRAHRLHWHHQSSRQSCLRIPPTTKGSGMVGRESPKKGLTWSFTDCRPFHLLPC